MYSKAAIGSRLPLRRGLSEPEAAVYIGLSPSSFVSLSARVNAASPLDRA